MEGGLLVDAELQVAALALHHALQFAALGGGHCQTIVLLDVQVLSDLGGDCAAGCRGVGGCETPQEAASDQFAQHEDSN